MTEEADVKESISISWSELTRWREECYRRFGSIRDLPLHAPYKKFQELLQSDSCVLDVGAGVHKSFSKYLTLSTQSYFSLDNDPAGDFDFRSFKDILADQEFDLIVANQVLEHLTIDDAFAMLRSAYRYQVADGYLLATVPNAAHPVRQWGDSTHLTAWSVNDLYSLVRNAGYYVISMFRYNKRPLTWNPIKRMVVNIVCETFRVDWCDSLMILGQKRTQDG